MINNRKDVGPNVYDAVGSDPTGGEGIPPTMESIEQVEQEIEIRKQGNSFIAIGLGGQVGEIMLDCPIPTTTTV
jgi:hypothetical protein